jgi:alginate O-acetyltransferase complex protein AlgI
MLFNSLPFLFGFLPIGLLVFYFLGNRSQPLASSWLVLLSIFFYGWWNPHFIILLLASVVLNYSTGYLINHAHNTTSGHARQFLILGIAIDLGLLAYYKYAAFLVDCAGSLLGFPVHIDHIPLPLGISFFTFTQIAFLVDVYQKKAKEFNFTLYLLFVTYFPHLIAGPILHHSQMMPQFAEKKTYKPNWFNLSAGWTIFIIGLAKKVLLADYLSGIASPAFGALAHGATMSALDAWIGALCYTLQLYFDFSGYCDMAIGLSLMFNVRLPINFNSPYKAANIIDFWRRWHMTLSAFLRDYLYIPLGGNRKGPIRRYVNLFLTMLLGGLWHGAGWTFVIWGMLHGTYLMINHGFRAVAGKLDWNTDGSGVWRVASWLLTFFAVVVAWVFFRADSLASAVNMLRGMAGAHGLVGGASVFDKVGRGQGAIAIVFGLLVVWLLPNSQQFMNDSRLYLDTVQPAQGWTSRLVWHPAWRFTPLLFGLLLSLCLLMMSPTHVSEFLYYQF